MPKVSRDVPCPTCGAEPGEQCTAARPHLPWKRRGRPLAASHPARVNAARAARDAAQALADLADDELNAAAAYTPEPEQRRQHSLDQANLEQYMGGPHPPA